MKSALLALAFLLMFQTPVVMPKHNPNGTWESTSGTQYQLQLSGTDLKVQLVAGSNPGFVSYDVALKNSADEVNTYLGSGSFVRKVKIQDEDKECKYETTWQIVVIAPDRIIGSSSNVVTIPGTCDVKQRDDPPNNPKAAYLDLKRK